MNEKAEMQRNAGKNKGKRRRDVEGRESKTKIEEKRKEGKKSTAANDIIRA